MAILNHTARQARIATYKPGIITKLAGKIIDTGKPEFADLKSDKGKPMSSLNGEIILERDLRPDGSLKGVISVHPDNLAAILPELKNATLDKTGWKKHLDQFKVDGVDLLQEISIADPTPDEYELSAAEELATLDIDSMSDFEAKQKLKDIKAKSVLEG